MEVVRTQRVADEVTAVWLRAQDGRPLPDYRPGQHIALPGRAGICQAVPAADLLVDA